jgi:hypothetical protein
LNEYKCVVVEEQILSYTRTSSIDAHVFSNKVSKFQPFLKSKNINEAKTYIDKKWKNKLDELK